MHVRVGVTSASFEYVTDCITCRECDLDINSFEKICKFSYHWVPVRESDPFLGAGRFICCVKVVMLVLVFLVYGVLRLLHREIHWS